METKKWKMLGIRISADVHEQLFNSLRKASKKSGRPWKASEVVVPAINAFIEKQK